MVVVVAEECSNSGSGRRCRQFFLVVFIGSRRQTFLVVFIVAVVLDIVVVVVIVVVVAVVVVVVFLLWLLLAHCALAKGAFNKSAAKLRPNVRGFAGISFRTSWEGRARFLRLCPRFELISGQADANTPLRLLFLGHKLADTPWKHKKSQEWYAPKPIPDKASHPNFPHIQSIEYTEHADQPCACWQWWRCKTQQNAVRNKKRKMRNMRTFNARENVTLPPRPKTFVSSFFPHLPGDLALKNGGDFWWFFCALRFLGNKARRILEKFGENWEGNSGENPGQKFEKFGNFRSATFLT